MTKRLVQWTAPHEVRYYGVGEHCADPVAGDLILVDHGTDMAWAIESGQWLLSRLPIVGEPELKEFCWMDHTAIIRQDDGKFMVSEMGPRGHELRPLEHYADRRYAVAHFASPVSRDAALDADARFHDIHYGFEQYPVLIVNGLTGAKIAASYGSSMICSTHVTMISENVYFTPDRQAGAVIPAHVGLWLDIPWTYESTALRIVPERTVLSK